MAEQGFEYVPALPDPEDLDMGTGPAAGTPEYVEIEAAVTLIAEFPPAGIPAPRRGGWAHRSPHDPHQGLSYLLAYSDDTDPLRVHRVLHTSRDIPAEPGRPHRRIVTAGAPFPGRLRWLVVCREACRRPASPSPATFPTTTKGHVHDLFEPRSLSNPLART